MNVFQRIERRMRRAVAGMFRGRFSRLYSMLDAPTLEVPAQVMVTQTPMVDSLCLVPAILLDYNS